jgi:hypothetical protein
MLNRRCGQRQFNSRRLKFPDWNSCNASPQRPRASVRQERGSSSAFRLGPTSFNNMEVHRE